MLAPNSGRRGRRCSISPLPSGAREGSERIRLGRRVHDVAQALHRDRGLLELLPQAGEPQHRLRHARREHLEGDQHADGEAVVAHDEQRADAQDGERHHLLERVRRDVVGVRELARREAGGEVGSRGSSS